jgi:hypothetical protein
MLSLTCMRLQARTTIEIATVCLACTMCQALPAFHSLLLTLATTKQGREIVPFFFFTNTDSEVRLCRKLAKMTQLEVQSNRVQSTVFPFYSFYYYYCRHLGGWDWSLNSGFTLAIRLSMARATPPAQLVSLFFCLVLFFWNAETQAFHAVPLSYTPSPWFFDWVPMYPTVAWKSPSFCLCPLRTGNTGLEAPPPPSTPTPMTTLPSFF